MKWDLYRVIVNSDYIFIGKTSTPFASSRCELHNYMVGENEEYKYHQYTNEKERSECEYTLITLLDILYVYTCILAQCVPVTTCRLINIFFI